MTTATEDGTRPRFAQPASAPDGADEHAWLVLGAANPFTPAQMQAMLPLDTPTVSAILEGLEPPVRLTVARELHNLREADADNLEFEAATSRARTRIEADREARRQLQEKRDAYLSSDEGLAGAAERFESQIVDLDDIPDPEPLIDGFLHRDTLVRTFGPPKSLKSFVTLDMAGCISLGIPWQGNETVQTTVLYIVAEGARGVKKRRAAWNAKHDTEMKVIFFPKPVQIADPEQMHDLIAFCRLKQVGYVVFDTQARCTVGVEENDNTEMGEIVSALDVLKQQTGACVHLVHHSGGSDPKKARGATAFDGAVDAEFYTRRDEKDTSSVRLVTKFQKDIGEADDVDMEAVEVGPSLVLVPAGGSVDIHTAPDAGESPAELPTVTPRSMEYLRLLNWYEGTPVGPSDAATQMNQEQGPKYTNRQLVRNAWVSLKKLGLADTVRDGKWIITPLGVSVIAREMTDRVGTERKWVDRPRRRKVSQEVSPAQAKLPPETSETSRNQKAKPPLTCDETKSPETET